MRLVLIAIWLSVIPGACKRWGDYFNICFDPDDSTLFWATGQLMQTGGDPEDERWTTQNYWLDDPD